MKPLSLKAMALWLALGMAVALSDTWAADWKVFARGTTGVFHYDVASLQSPSKGAVRVWIHNSTQHLTYLAELNCQEGSYRVLDRVEYGEGEQVKTRDTYYENTHWVAIPPGSVLEELRSLVCK
jgi:hypothetical protein